MTERDAFELLRRANPVQRDAIAALSARFSAEEATRLRARSAGAPAATQAAPSAPRRRRPGRAVLAVAGPAAALIAAGSAIGLNLDVVEFSSAERAPQPIQREFSDLSVGAPPGMDPGAIAGDTRKVMTRTVGNRLRTLWVAPAKSGGFCAVWTELVGGCRAPGGPDLSATYFVRPASEGGYAVVEMMAGSVSHERVKAVEVRFQDGTAVRTKVVWVSAPINAGFFIYEVPVRHRTPGSLVSAVVGLDSRGDVVAVAPKRPGMP